MKETPTKDLKLSESEMVLLRLLERRVREMFAFTGWKDDVDDEAKIAVVRVEDALDNLDAVNRVISGCASVSAGSGNG
jgi:hypothetical protein